MGFWGGLMSQLREYITAWQRHDVTAVLATLTDDCVITECYGPVYHGKPRVEQWMNAWFEAGGSVDKWEIASHATAGGGPGHWTGPCKYALAAAVLQIL